MPLLLHRHIEPAGEIGIWQIEEPEEWFRHRLDLSEEEHRQFDPIKGRKRVEWLAARHLVHHMSGRPVRGAFWKDDFGKPHLENSPYQISISHSGDRAAAIAAPFPVGIDIQHIVEKIGRIAAKFLRPEELASLRNDTRLEHLHVYWGAKEALYKAYGRKKLDFCAHIYVEPFVYEPSPGRCRGRIVKDGYDAAFRVHYERLEDYMLVYAVGD